MTKNVLQELLLYCVSTALSSLVLFVGLRQLDPNRESAEKALQHKKEIAKRLGRPLVQTNSYEMWGDQLPLEGFIQSVKDSLVRGG